MIVRFSLPHKIACSIARIHAQAQLTQTRMRTDLNEPKGERKCLLQTILQFIVFISKIINVL